MTPFWHPLSAVLLSDPRVYATPHLLRLMMGASGSAKVVYAGDRMWPAVHDQASIVVDRIAAADARPGDVLLASPGGIPDLLRLEGMRAGRLVLRGDADPLETFEAGTEEVLGRARLGRRRATRHGRALRRTALDLREAALRGVGRAADPAESIRRKYDAQAPFYAGSGAIDIDPALLRWARRTIRRGGRVLVAGSGTGREAFALAAAGWEVKGIDYAPAMIEASRSEARRRGVTVDLALGDLRSHDEDRASLAAVFFTYDVYSFVPFRRDRISLLRRLAGWLEAGGSVFLAARRVRTPWQRAILTLQRARRGRSAGTEWGASHTRFIGPDGVLGRSFVHYFTGRSLGGEIAEGGFVQEETEAGHVRIRPRGPLRGT